MGDVKRHGNCRQLDLAFFLHLFHHLVWHNFLNSNLDEHVNGKSKRLHLPIRSYSAVNEQDHQIIHSSLQLISLFIEQTINSHLSPNAICFFSSRSVPVIFYDSSGTPGNMWSNYTPFRPIIAIQKINHGPFLVVKRIAIDCVLNHNILLILTAKITDQIKYINIQMTHFQGVSHCSTWI